MSRRVRQSLGETFRFVELANDVNDHTPTFVVNRLIEALNERSLSVRGRRILLLDLACKRNTGDARESPSRPIATRLVELGADVVAADPHVEESLLPAGVTKVDLRPRHPPLHLRRHRRAPLTQSTGSTAGMW